MIETKTNGPLPEHPAVDSTASPVAPADEAAPATLQPVRKGSSNTMRRVGNVLIALGLLLMFGVGGYLAYQTYTNDQITQQINRESAQSPNLAPPAASSTPGQGNAAGGKGATSSAGGTAAAAVPGDDTVRVEYAPLPSLNRVQLGQSFVGMPLNKPPLKIEIPSVGINTSIVPVGWEMIPGKEAQGASRWKVAENAAGHHEGTANPGQVGNIVISGHVDWKGEVFKNLHQIKRGAEVHIYTEDREYLYIVQDIHLVLEDGATDEQKRANASFMDPTPSETLTLITCFPYGIDDHRLIVIAKPYDSNLLSRPDLIVK